MGNFIIQDIEPNDTTNINRVTAMDYMLKTNTEYITELNYNSNKITVLEVLQEICTKLGLELATTEFANSNFIVDSNQFEEGSLYRQVIQAIAQISGTFAKIKSDNKLYLITPKLTSGILVKDVDVMTVEELNLLPITILSECKNQLTSSNYKELVVKRNTHPINLVSLGMSDVEGENIVLRDKESIDKDGENSLVINDNPFAYTEEKRKQLITAIYDVVKGFEYTAFEIQGQSKPYLETGDEVVVIDKEGNLYSSFLFRFNFKSPNGLESEMSAPSLTKATVNYQNIPDALEIAKRTEIVVNKQKQTITQLVKETGNHEKRINQIETSTEGLLLRAQKNIDLMSIAEGNNLTINALEDKATFSIKGNTEYVLGENYLTSYDFTTSEGQIVEQIENGMRITANGKDISSLVEKDLEENTKYKLKMTLGEYTSNSTTVTVTLGNDYLNKLTLDLKENEELEFTTLENGRVEICFDFYEGYIEVTDISLRKENSTTIQSLGEYGNFSFYIRNNENNSSKIINIPTPSLYKLGDVTDEMTEEGIIKKIEVIDENATTIEEMLAVKEQEEMISLTEEQKAVFDNLKTYKGTNIIGINGNIKPSQFIFKYFENTDKTKMQENIAELKVKNDEISSEVKKKVGEDEVISKINQSAEAVGIDANKIHLSALDILNLLAGNTINLSSKNITISSDNFNVDKDGNITIGGSEDSPALVSKDTSLGAETSFFPLGILNEVNGYYAAVMKGGIGVGRYIGDSMEETVTIDYSGVRAPTITQTSLESKKKNFEKLQNGLDIVKATEIYKYNLKSQADGDKKHIGFVIGKNYKYSKEITALDKEGNEVGVDSYSMIAAAYKAIQEQQEVIEELQQKLKEMEGK